MVGSTGTLMTMRLVRSKLRKREETSVSPVNVEAQITTTTASSQHNSNNNSNHHNHINNSNHHSFNNHQQNQNQHHNHHHTTSSQILSAATLTTSAGQTTIITEQQIISGGCTGQQVQQQQQQQQQIQINQNQPIAYRQNPSSVWVFPPLPPQPNIFHCANHHDALSQLNDKSGFRGFRKQFSGRFKRLVAKKTHEPAPAIPPELKPQLKTIYVY